jgi:hypothetical protein
MERASRLAANLTHYLRDCQPAAPRVISAFLRFSCPVLSQDCVEDPQNPPDSPVNILYFQHVELDSIVHQRSPNSKCDLSHPRSRP